MPHKDKEARKEYMKEYWKEYYKNNREKLSKKSRQWQKDNREKANKNSMRCYEKNYEKNYEKRKEDHKQYMNLKRRMDLKYNLNHKISGEIYKSLKRNKNGWHWEILVGYTLDSLKKHLQKTMPKRYTWNDYLKGRLHIDHKIPISAFNFTKSEHIDFKRCWALSNLRLLPARENIIKSNHLSRPFQPALQI